MTTLVLSPEHDEGTIDGEESFIDDVLDWSSDDEVHEGFSLGDEVEQQVFRFAENTTEVNIAVSVLDEILANVETRSKVIEAFAKFEDEVTTSETYEVPEINPVLETISEASSIDSTSSPVGATSRSPPVTPPPASPTWGDKRRVEESYRGYGYLKKLKCFDLELELEEIKDEKEQD